MLDEVVCPSGGGCGIRRIFSLPFLSGRGRFRQENHGQLLYG